MTRLGEPRSMRATAGALLISALIASLTLVMYAYITVGATSHHAAAAATTAITGCRDDRLDRIPAGRHSTNHPERPPCPTSTHPSDPPDARSTSGTVIREYVPATS